LPEIDIHYNWSSGLPSATVIMGMCGPSANLSLMIENNQNLSMGQKVRGAIALHT